MPKKETKGPSEKMLERKAKQAAAKADRAAKKAEKEGKTIVDANAELKAARVVAGETMEAFKAAAAAATTALTAKYAAIAIQTTAGDKFAELCGLGDEADDAELAAAEAASEAADAEAEKLTAEVVAADVLEAETKAASEQAAGIVTKIEDSSTVSAAKASGGFDANAKSGVDGSDVTHRTCTGELAMIAGAKDVKIISFSLSFHGENLIEDTTLELSYGRRYGLIGRNGSGKSTFLEALAAGDLELPSHIDKYLLNKEAAPTDRTALETVVDEAKLEVARLNALEEKLMIEEGPDCPDLLPIYDKLEELDPTTFDQRAGSILWGLGFKKEMMAKATKDMSGGWRMRVALARALFIAPTLLLMDEPTNHLDLETCVWLENYLSTYPKILMMVSHSQDFLDGTCTNIMHLTPKKKLVVYKGNYTMFCQTKVENEIQQDKQYKKQQEEIADIKKFISSCGTYSNMVKQASSRQKQLDKMIDRGLIEAIDHEFDVKLDFPSCEKLAPPVLAFNMVSFSYSGDKANPLLKELEFGIDMDSRIVLVGPNGAGKSTLLKMIVDELSPTTGDIQRHGHLKVARYNQHSEEILDEEMNPLDWIMQQFPLPKTDPEEWRRRLGRYGVSGKRQVRPIGTLSDGQKTQLVFAWLAQQNPHMLLFDEPTNHLDMESIDSLADAINKFTGGMVLVSHDFRLLEKTAREIWVVEDKRITPWKGDIASYKKHLAKSFKAFE